MLSIPVLIYSILNEPLAPEDFELAMDDLQTDGGGLQAAKPFARERAASTLQFPPFNGEAA